MMVGWRDQIDAGSRMPGGGYFGGDFPPRQMAAFVGEAVVGVGLAGAQVLLILALADFAYQRWSFNRSARMTKQEVKEEYKQQEGDPQLKAQVRSRQRKLAATRRQFLDVPQAAVVLTNPTHLAIALQYDRTMAGVATTSRREHTEVSATVVGTALVTASASEARVLVFVNQSTTGDDLDKPLLDLDRVLVTLVRAGGVWKVSELDAL